MAPVSFMAGVSEASHKRVHSIPVVGGLDSQPMIVSRVTNAQASELGRLFHLGGAASLLLRVNRFDLNEETLTVVEYSGRHRKIRSVINLQMGPQAGGDACPIIEVALADADKVFI